MIYTVSTVKDATASIETFIRRNLAAGADHLVIFLDDADDAEATAQADALAGPHVTVVPTGAEYWQGRRPASLNQRQSTNAYLANLLLCGMPEAEWLFHIDADECLDVDLDHLGALAPEQHVVRLRPLEAVARSEWPDEVTHFKRRLTKPELREVCRRGLIDRPVNNAYFRGHIMGKVGVRPSPYLWVGIHYATTEHGAWLQEHASDALQMLHYDSHTGEEFVRKWSNLLRGGARQKRRAGHIAELVEPIAASDAGPEEKRRRLWDLFRTERQDDFEALEGLGLLVTPDPARHAHQPAMLSLEQAEQLQTILGLLLQADRRYMSRFASAYPAVVLLRDVIDQARADGRTALVAALRESLKVRARAPRAVGR